MGMTNKPSMNHVRFNKQPTAQKGAKKASQVPKARAKTKPKKASATPYVSDLSQRPSMLKDEKKQYRKVLWVLCVIFVLGCVDVVLPSLKNMPNGWFSDMPFSGGVLSQLGGVWQKKEDAVLLMDTVGYATPSHFDDPVIHLVSGMKLSVEERKGAWAYVRSEAAGLSFWVDANTLLLDN